MIAALVSKDLNLIARDRIFHFALIGFMLIYLTASLLFISSFLVAGNYPFATASELFFSRISLLQGVILAAFIPWIMLRMHEQDLSRERNPLGMVATPYQIILSKLIASSLCLVNLIVLSLPVLCIARLLGAATFRQIGWVLLDTCLFLMLIAVLAIHLRLQFTHWLSCWVLSYVALGLAGFAWYKAWMTIGGGSCTMLFSLLLVFFTVLLFPHGRRVLLYERN